MKIAWKSVWVCNPSILQANPMKYAKENVMLSFEVLYVSSGELKSLGFEGTGYEVCVRNGSGM